MSSLIFSLLGNPNTLGFDIFNNANQQSQIFVESGNDINITITNNSGKTVTIPGGGTPVPLTPTDKQYGYLYIEFNAALRNALDMEDITASNLTTGDTNKWTITTFNDGQNGTY